MFDTGSHERDVPVDRPHLTVHPRPGTAIDSSVDRFEVSIDHTLLTDRDPTVDSLQILDPRPIAHLDTTVDRAAVAADLTFRSDPNAAVDCQNSFGSGRPVIDSIRLVDAAPNSHDSADSNRNQNLS